MGPEKSNVGREGGFKRKVLKGKSANRLTVNVKKLEPGGGRVCQEKTTISRKK